MTKISVSFLLVVFFILFFKNSAMADDIFFDILKNDLEKVRHAIDGNPKLLELKSLNGATPLYAAADAGSAGIVEYLLNKGADVNFTSDMYSYYTPLFTACYNGRERIVKMLLDKGADPNVADSNGLTPLHEAASRGFVNIARMLLDRGAKTEVRGFRDGYTVLHSACFEYSNIEIPGSLKAKSDAVIDRPGTIRLLIEKGAKISAFDFRGRTPLKIVETVGCLDKSVNENVRAVLSAAGAKSEEAKPCANDVLEAIKKDDAKTLREIISEIPEALILQDNNMPLLSIAIRDGKNAIVEVLLDCSADSNSLSFNDSYGYARHSSPLHVACNVNNTVAVELLLKTKKAGLEIKDGRGRTPLLIAAEKGFDGLVKTLAENGADVNASTSYDGGALHHMAAKGYADIVELLIQKGADANTVNDRGQTPAQCAEAANQKRVLEILKKHGAKGPEDEKKINIHEEAGRGDVKKIAAILGRDPKLVNSKKARDGSTPLHAAALAGYDYAASFLIEHGAVIDAADLGGMSPLFYALMKGRQKVVRLLIEKGANVNMKARGNVLPVHIAASAGFTVSRLLTYMLVARGADVNARTDAGLTPLHAAAASNNIDTIKLLLSRGASFDTKDKNGLTPLALAEKMHQKDAADFIKNCDWKSLIAPSTEELFMAASVGDLANVKKIIEKFPSAISSRDISGGNTPLHYAAMNGDIDIVSYLLEHGADIEETGPNGWTPLETIATVPFHANHPKIIAALEAKGAVPGGPRRHAGIRDVRETGRATGVMFEAVGNGHVRLVEMILKKGVDMKARSAQYTFLHYAVLTGRVDIAKLLIANGAELNPKGMDDTTPLHIAAESGNAELAILLIEKGADINAVTRDGKTALIIARENGREDVVKILETAGKK